MNNQTDSRNPNFLDAFEETAHRVRTARTLAKATIQAMPDKGTEENEEVLNLLLVLSDQLDLAQTALDSMERG